MIYHFGAGRADGSPQMRHILGGKGANMAEMSRLGLPVPPGFTVSAEACAQFLESDAAAMEAEGNGRQPDLPESLKRLIKKSLRRLEDSLGKTFGGAENPLLLSVRSGAPASMPGMMDTILNLGLNQKTTEGLARASRDPRFAYDSCRRFIQMHSTVAMGMNGSLMEVYLDEYKSRHGLLLDSEISAEGWKGIAAHFKDMILRDTGRAFPEDPWEQLWQASAAVFRSWNSPRAIVYRQKNGSIQASGTALNIQAMVFGNRGPDSATGVVFTRNPSTGEKSLFGEYLVNAQGEDVVAGARTPNLIINPPQSRKKDLGSLMPEAFRELSDVCKKLERRFGYVQDIEFTIEKNKLWLLQTRSAKCAPAAQLKIIFDLVEEGLLTEKQALEKADPSLLTAILHPFLDKTDKKACQRAFLARGLPASPGGAAGKIALDGAAAAKFRKQGEPAILVRTETSPEDISGMIAAKGILTARGGMTSHAAVVARSMGKPCAAGCEALSIDESARSLRIGGKTLKEGDEISIDGATGEVFLGLMKTRPPALDQNFERLMSLSDKYARLESRANADTPQDARRAKKFGARGIGLCRTEHMFFAPARIAIMRKIIMAESGEERDEDLNRLFAMQKEDFLQMLEIMNSLPVTVRLLDPPLHEFLPQTEGAARGLAKKMEWDPEKLWRKIKSLQESNPMLGRRGCRLAIACPKIYLMQARALAEAAAELKKRRLNPMAEIMIPFVCHPEEMRLLRRMIQAEIERAEKAFQIRLPIPIGTMIEIPRACLEAEKIAAEADFFSFGTNDLTQMALGISRDDAGKFLPSYINEGIFGADPFSRLDMGGAGELIKMAADRGRRAKPGLKLGVCGEQGGDPESLRFFHQAGLDYISCSPYRLPAARLAAARAAIQEENIHAYKKA